MTFLSIFSFFHFVACSTSGSVETADSPVDDSPEEIIEAVPEEPERETMRIDFGGEKDGDNWYVLNDSVMGGVSWGELTYTESSIVFEGEVSLDNNGGFASIRTENDTIDLSAYTDVAIRYKVTGHDFSMIIADKNAWYLPQYKHVLATQSDDWNVVELSLYDFVQYEMTYFGEQETGVEMSPDYLSQVLRLELMNSETKAGPFRLEIDYIEFIGEVITDTENP